MKDVLQKLIQRSRASRGFTLIELLVVIAIIGILAVAVLSAINPLEQINKGRDTSTNADAAQLQGAVERYYANLQTYPWNTNATGFTATVTVANNAYAFNGTATTPNWNWTNNLKTSSEIKDTFATRLQASRTLFVMKDAGSNATTYVCFYPISNSQRLLADKYCGANGGTVNTIATNTSLGIVPCATTNGSAPTTAGTNAICVP